MVQGEFPVEDLRVKGPLNGNCFIFQHGVMDLCGQEIKADASHRKPVVSWTHQFNSSNLDSAKHVKGCHCLLCARELVGASYCLSQ